MVAAIARPSGADRLLGSSCLVITDERVPYRLEEVRWQEPVLVLVGLRYFL